MVATTTPIFFMLFLPPLRHFVTPLLKERLVWLLSWEAVNNVDCGVALSVLF